MTTRKQAAQILGVTEKSLGNWVHEDWFPQAGRTKSGWDVDLIRNARDQHGKKGSRDNDNDRKIRSATNAQKLRFEKTRADRAELSLKREEGELIPRVAVELFAATLLTELSDWAEQLPDIIANAVPDKYREAVRERMIFEFKERRQATRDRLEREAKHIDQQNGAR